MLLVYVSCNVLKEMCSEGYQKPRPIAHVEEFAAMLFRRRERSLSLRLLKTLLRLQLKEVFSTDLISRRGVNTTRRGALFTR